MDRQEIPPSIWPRSTRAACLTVLTALVISACSPPGSQQLAGEDLAIYARARTAFVQGDATLARTILTPLLTSSDRNIQTAILAGRIDLIDGQLESAVGHLQRALELEPAASDAAWWLAQALMLQGRYADARGVVIEALVTATDDPRLVLALADIESQLGNTDRAIELYERVLSFSEQLAPAAIRLGEFYRRAGLDERARGSYERALVLLPEDSGLIRVVRDRMAGLP